MRYVLRCEGEPAPVLCERHGAFSVPLARIRSGKAAGALAASCPVCAESGADDAEPTLPLQSLPRFRAVELDAQEPKPSGTRMTARVFPAASDALDLACYADSAADAPFSRARVFTEEVRRLEALDSDALADRLVGLLLANRRGRAEKKRSLTMWLPEGVAESVDGMAGRVGLFRPDTVLSICFSCLLRANEDGID